MARPLVPDELWEIIEPLLPRHKARPGKRGRPPVDDRACLTGIIFVLQSGIPWWMLPQEMGCGSGVTCWRRLRYWQRCGVWKKLLHALLRQSALAALGCPKVNLLVRVTNRVVVPFYESCGYAVEERVSMAAIMTSAG